MRFYTSYTNRRHNSYGAGTLAGYDVHTRGWDAGVRVTPREAGPDGKQDDFDVHMTTGSHESGHNTHLGTVHGTPDGPVWEPAAGRMTDRHVYSLAELRTGTGFPRGARFMMLPPDAEVSEDQPGADAARMPAALEC